MSTTQVHPAERADFVNTNSNWQDRRMQEESIEHEISPRKRFIATDSHYVEHSGFSLRHMGHGDASTSSQSFKKQKTDLDNSAEVYVGTKSPKKIDASELAASFALASLASLSPQRAELREGIDEASVEEARSPRAEPNPVSPEKRSPIRPILKKVHFASHVKDFHEACTRPLGRTMSHPRPPIFHRRPGAFEPFAAIRYPIFHHSARPPTHQPPPFWIQHPMSNGPRQMHPPHMLMQPPLIRPVPAKQWICDYCNVAAFKSFQEACIHEECCKARFVSSNSFPPMRKPLFPPLPRRVEDDDRDMCYERCDSTVASGDQSMIRGQDDEVTPRNVTVLDPDHQEWFAGSVALAMHPADSEWLSEVNCYVRQHCVEAFSATHEDIAKTSKRGRISLHQVGIRCRFCRGRTIKDKEIAAVSYPTSTAGIYESVKRWQRVHLEACQDIPLPVKNHLLELQGANVWVPTTRQYWADSAKALGMVDTSDGIRFGKDPRGQADFTKDREPTQTISKLPSSPPPFHGTLNETNEVDEKHVENSTAAPKPGACKALERGEVVVFPEDQQLVPPYVLFLMKQVETCHFTEADRFVARSKGPVGFAGFQCRYCNGHAGLGKYFPISAKSLSTNSTSQNIHAHLLKCRKCPAAVKEELLALKTAKGKSPRLEPGWRKVFFDMIWDRLHGKSQRNSIL